MFILCSASHVVMFMLDVVSANACYPLATKNEHRVYLFLCGKFHDQVDAKWIVIRDSN
jgi:hypothetical protein